MNKYKYFQEPTDRAVSNMRLELFGASETIRELMEMGEYNEDSTVLASIYVGDQAGRYAMMEFTCMVTDITPEEYKEKYDLDNGSKQEEEIGDFDELLDDVNEELKVWMVDTGLDKEFAGYTPYIGWWEGHIVMYLYPES